MLFPNNYKSILLLIIVLLLSACQQVNNSSKVPDNSTNPLKDQELVYTTYQAKSTDRVISRSAYKDQLHGFWLAQCIANWTGLVTEMDKVGNIGSVKTGDFYTREDWGKPDLPNIWSGDKPSDLSETIDFVFEDKNGIWGADDDTDIEYIFQHLLYTNKTSLLTGQQIQEGWLKHIKPEEENFLWVANQKALDMMLAGHVPPATSDPKITTDTIYDNYYEMIDAQLTTEIFGFFAPSRPDIALKMAKMPIQTTARDNAEWISEFNVIMYALASYHKEGDKTMKERIFWMADEARKRLPNASYSAKMYDFVKSKYDANVPWEQARDALYQRYQVEQADGYNMTDKNIFCNGCFVGGINFGASIVSLLYGEGDLKETIKIGALAGWDSDNPTATWGGLLGFMLGKEGVEKAFDRKFSDKFNIHRTRINFPNNGMDDFNSMAKKGVYVIDRVIQEEMKGGINLEKDEWYIPSVKLNISEGTKYQATTSNTKLSVILDTDANNELDDQHALAYLFFNENSFDIKAITVNATRNGGNIDGHYLEAERIMKLCETAGKIPLLKGANKSFTDIEGDIGNANYDGQEAVDFIIKEAKKYTKEKLVIIAVGKLTNLALALKKEPTIASNIRLVWLGANYPDPGEYNLEDDIPSMNFVLKTKVDFEMVTVRYGKPTGTDVVSVTKAEALKNMPGLGPKIAKPITGRHGGAFYTFGDYAANLFKHIEYYGDPPARALFDMAAVAIVKNPDWATATTIPSPIMIDEKWVEQPNNPRKIKIWENFDKKEIIADFYASFKKENH